MRKKKQRGGQNPKRKIDKATRIPLVQSLEAFCDSHEEGNIFLSSYRGNLALLWLECCWF